MKGSSWSKVELEQVLPNLGAEKRYRREVWMRKTRHRDKSRSRSSKHCPELGIQDTIRKKDPKSRVSSRKLGIRPWTDRLRGLLGRPSYRRLSVGLTTIPPPPPVNEHHLPDRLILIRRG